METSLVSIIIPTFNRENLVKDTLDSILGQTYPHWECLIVDDGSNADTINLIESYCNRDDRFKLTRRELNPKGAPTCRNIGMARASGEFIIFLDSDDILFPFALEERKDFLNEHPDVDFCIADGIRGTFPLKRSNEYHLISTFKSKEVLPQFFNFTIPWNTLNVMYRRVSLLNKKIKWTEDVKAYQDIDFHVKCVLSGLRFDYCKQEPDCLWREHDQGNIGQRELNSIVEDVTKKIDILKSVIRHPRIRQDDCTPLFAHLMGMFLNSDTQVSLYNDLFKSLYHNPFRRVFFKTVFSLFRWSKKNNIKKVKGFLYLTLARCNQRRFMTNQKNEYFLTTPYNPVTE